MTQPGTVSVVPMTAGHVDALMRYEDEMFGSEAWSANAYRDEIADTRSRGYFAAVDDAGEVSAAGCSGPCLGKQRAGAPAKPSSRCEWTTWPRAGCTRRKDSPRWDGGAAITMPVAWTRWSCARSCRGDQRNCDRIVRRGVGPRHRDIMRRDGRRARSGPNSPGRCGSQQR